MRNQCRARTSLWALGWTPPLPGGGQRQQQVLRQPPQAGESECNRDSTTMAGRGTAKKVESQEAQWAGSSLQLLRCWESPQPHASPETKAGGCKVWQFGLQVFVSIHHPGQPLASHSLCVSAPWGRKEATLSATSVCPNHLKGACGASPLVPEAGGRWVEGWGSWGTCPQAGRGQGRVLRTGEGGQWERLDYCPVRECSC